METSVLYDVLSSICKDITINSNFVPEGTKCDSLFCIKTNNKLIFRKSFEKIMFVWNDQWLRIADRKLKKFNDQELNKQFGNYKEKILCFGYARGYLKGDWKKKNGVT
jgi:hypothetical protein